MTKEQFISLLRSPSTINLNLVKDLEEITERFPYFQNAHLLLAKQYQGHQNIRYESYLRKAAAYAPDRSLLYQLIKLPPAEVIHMKSPGQAVADEQPGEPVEITDEKIPSLPTPVNTLPEPDTASPEIKPVNLEPEPTPIKSILSTGEQSATEQAEEATVKQTDETISQVKEEPAQPVSRQQEILEKRLREISGAETEAPIREEKPAREKKPQKDQHTLAEHEKPAREKKPLKDHESFLKQEEKQGTEKTPEKDQRPFPERDEKPTRPEREEKTAKQEKKPLKDQHTFLEWLKLKNIPVHPAEEIPTYTFPNSDQTGAATSLKQEDDLIESFIRNEPRIVPAKSEFYSPGNMARQSAVEHEDLISETLARIYAQQGNIPKAIDAYQRLSLKMPEKSGYFAALIRELEAQNNQD